jgi:hypothetical protein
MVQNNLEFEVVYEDVISMLLVYLLSTISFLAYFDVFCNKRWKHQLLDGEIWTAHRDVNPCGLFVRWGGVYG